MKSSVCDSFGPELIAVAHPAIDFAPEDAGADWFGPTVKLGASFTAVTVRTNVSVAVSEPSLTVTVMVEVPFWFAAGVTQAPRGARCPGT